MIANKISQFSILLILNLFPMTLFAQEDVSVEFSFKKPNEYVCKIQNMTDYRITIWLSKVEAEGHSDLYFDIVKDGNDTVRNVYYGLMKDINNQSQVLRLDPRHIYTVSYKEYVRFIKATILIKYYLEIPDNKVRFYEKEFDLMKIRCPQDVLRE